MIVLPLKSVMASAPLRRGFLLPTADRARAQFELQRGVGLPSGSVHFLRRDAAPQPPAGGAFLCPDHGSSSRSRVWLVHLDHSPRLRRWGFSFALAAAPNKRKPVEQISRSELPWSSDFEHARLHRVCGRCPALLRRGGGARLVAGPAQKTPQEGPIALLIGGFSLIGCGADHSKARRRRASPAFRTWWRTLHPARHASTRVERGFLYHRLRYFAKALRNQSANSPFSMRAIPDRQNVGGDKQSPASAASPTLRSGAHHSVSNQPPLNGSSLTYPGVRHGRRFLASSRRIPKCCGARLSLCAIAEGGSTPIAAQFEHNGERIALSRIQIRCGLANASRQSVARARHWCRP